MTSKKSKLCCARPRAQPQNLHIWLCFENGTRAQDVAEPPERSQLEDTWKQDAAWETGKQKVRGAQRTPSEGARGWAAPMQV